MKLLGIDYGEKRVGIALSDESGTMAFPKEVIENNKDLLEKIVSLIKSENVKTVIIGESRDFLGKENPIMKKIRAFKKNLEKSVSIPVYFEPEFLTSAEAKQGQEDVKIIDASAATIILQSFIDKQHD